VVPFAARGDFAPAHPRAHQSEKRVLVTTADQAHVRGSVGALYGSRQQVCVSASEVSTLDRVKILRDLRPRVYDVLIGVNLLREGLDCRRCPLVAVLARTRRIPAFGRLSDQTMGPRGAQYQRPGDPVRGCMTDSMRRAIDETMHAAPAACVK